MKGASKARTKSKEQAKDTATKPMKVTTWIWMDNQSVSTFNRRADFSSYLAEAVVLHAVGPGVDEELVDDGDVQEVHHVGNLGQRLEDAPGEEFVDQAQT